MTKDKEVEERFVCLLWLYQTLQRRQHHTEVNWKRGNYSKTFKSMKKKKQNKKPTNFYLFKLSAPDQMKATDEKHIV